MVNIPYSILKIYHLTPTLHIPSKTKTHLQLKIKTCVNMEKRFSHRNIFILVRIQVPIPHKLKKSKVQYPPHLGHELLEQDLRQLGLALSRPNVIVIPPLGHITSPLDKILEGNYIKTILFYGSNQIFSTWITGKDYQV